MIFGIISIILWVGSIIGFVVWNLLKKNRELESMVIGQSNFVNETVVMLDQFNLLVNKIDMTMWVQSDPELFNCLKQSNRFKRRFNNSLVEDNMSVEIEKDIEFIGLTKKGAVRKRKPKTKNVYFTSDTEEAILRYRKALSIEERNKI